VLQSVAGYCRVLQGVAERCRVLQGVAGCCRVLRVVAQGSKVLHSVAEYCRVLQCVQCVAVCCSVLQASVPFQNTSKAAPAKWPDVMCCTSASLSITPKKNVSHVTCCTSAFLYGTPIFMSLISCTAPFD